jgi:hypothetical protein
MTCLNWLNAESCGAMADNINHIAIFICVWLTSRTLLEGAGRLAYATMIRLSSTVSITELTVITYLKLEFLAWKRRSMKRQSKF